MIDSGEVIEVGPDAILLCESFERMKSTVMEFISKNGPATVSQLREALQSSRRVMVPFLEYLDIAGVTKRVGDERVLAKKASAAKLSDAATASPT